MKLKSATYRRLQGVRCMIWEFTNGSTAEYWHDDKLPKPGLPVVCLINLTGPMKKRPPSCTITWRDEDGVRHIDTFENSTDDPIIVNLAEQFRSDLASDRWREGTVVWPVGAD